MSVGFRNLRIPGPFGVVRHRMSSIHMAEILPRLRAVLDVLPSEDPDRPGVLLRDPYRYADSIIYLPPVWAFALNCLDGERTELDLQELLTRATGQIVLSTEIRKFVGLLDEQGFLDTSRFRCLKDRREGEFHASPERRPIHAGLSYPATADEVKSKLDGYGAELAQPAVCFGPSTIGVAAPHVSPDGGAACYAAAYRPLAARRDLAERTFVILGTSHYGDPHRFGLTRKPYVTPLGRANVNTELAGWLEVRAGEALVREDYCHAIEHSIEFQCLFLQHAFGGDITILPVLCGPFSDSLFTRRPPEEDVAVARFFDALTEMAQLRGRELFWVLGIDMAHIGTRYGDTFEAHAGQGTMRAVAEQDKRRIELAAAGDTAGFFELLSRDADQLRWCGYSALYTFLKAVPSARGQLLRYDQWNIDEHSVVTFAGLEFKSA
jgi:MEMO1 family protein